MTFMTNWALWGTLVNTVLVLFGALLGLLIAKIGKRRSATANEVDDKGNALSGAVLHALGLCVFLIGILGAVKINNVLVMIVSVALGTLLGELLGLDALVNRLGALLEKRLGGRDGQIAEGFVAATLLFCVGAMTVTGAIEGGMARIHTTYYAKGLIDMVAAVVFASTLGFGVVLSAGSVFLVQGSLTLLAVLAADAIPLAVVGEIMAVGSLLVIGIGTNLLGLTKLKVMNMLPAMFLPLALCPLFELLSL